MKNLELDLEKSGFDLFSWFNTAAYFHPDHRLENYARKHGALAIVIGNSKALWDPFLASRPAGPNPLDHYTEQAIQNACASQEHRSTIYFGHTTEPAPIPIQHIAQTAGLARIGPAGLCIHSRHGLWFGLRAVVTFDVPGPVGQQAPEDLCSACRDKPCVKALEYAITLGKTATWHNWLAVRDACPVGIASRYDQGQLTYHYTKDPRALLVDQT